MICSNSVKTIPDMTSILYESSFIENMTLNILNIACFAMGWFLFVQKKRHYTQQK